jgi:membrane protein involved in colicin uptake
MDIPMMKLRQALALLPIVLSVVVAYPGSVFAQSSMGPTFDPVTSALAGRDPPVLGPNAPSGPGITVLTPEQQAEADRQKQLQEIQAKKEEAHKKQQAEEAARKAKEEAEKQAEVQRMAALKAAREAKDAETKHNREELTALLAEEKTARKSYEQAKQGATGDAVNQIETDYKKAEKDRQEKIKELRHPKYKPLKDYMPAGSSTGTTALPGSVSSGSGATVTQH